MATLDCHTSPIASNIQPIELWGCREATRTPILILLFPDGRLPSPRWRHVARLAGVALAVSSLAITFSPGPIEDDLLPRATWGCREATRTPTTEKANISTLRKTPLGSPEGPSQR
jgi:hypothetical protein